MRKRPTQLATCESVAAIVLHLRVVTPAFPVNLGGHAVNAVTNERGRPRALCDAEVAWDTLLPLEAVRCETCLRASNDHVPWTGPHERDLAADGVSLRWHVPAERWPFGPPGYHEVGCGLFPRGHKNPRGPHPGTLYCDCAASAADDAEFGEATHCPDPPNTTDAPGRGRPRA